MNLRRITSEQLVRAVVELQSVEKKVQKRSPVTMNGIKSVIRSFFKWGYETGRSSKNPALLLRLSRTISARTVPITAQEIENFLHAIRTSNDKNRLRDEALFAIYAYTGVRRTEALKLLLTDVDLSTGSLYINHPKNGKSRYQPIPNRLLHILNTYLSSHRFGEKSSVGPLFPGRTAGVHLSIKQTWVRFGKWKQLSGIRDNLTIHSFRAGFATILYNFSPDVLLVSRAMGHKDPKVTGRYVNDNVTRVRKAVDAAFPG
jgi:integrase/recombinase XerC